MSLINYTHLQIYVITISVRVGAQGEYRSRLRRVVHSGLLQQANSGILFATLIFQLWFVVYIALIL
jgi:hypothetical protein